MAEAKSKAKKVTEETPEVVEIIENEAIAPEAEPKATEKAAKAGKHSKKALEEEAEAEAKEAAKTARKEKAAAKEVEHKSHVPTPKNMERAHSKTWRAASKSIDQTREYELREAIELIQKASKTKFDATMELHINLGIDPRQSDQAVRTSTTLPSGSGKSVRVAVVAGEKDAVAAKAAGADVVDGEKIMAGIAAEKFDFDVLITTPDQMPNLARHAKILGPRGLMPSPKAGTVSTDVAATVHEIKGGRVEIKADPSGIIHLAFGKVSFKAADLATNAAAVFAAVVKARPATIKGVYLKSASISATMTPSARLDVAIVTKAKK